MKTIMKKTISEIFNSFSRTLRLLMILCVVLNYAVESLSRRSPAAALRFVVVRPYLFLLGCLILFVTLCLSFFFPRRAFGVALIGGLWLVGGIVNFFVTGYRTTPFSAMDLLKLGSVVGVTTVYFSIWQLVLMGLGILTALGGLVFLFLRSRKYPVLRNLPKAMAALLAGGILAAAMLLLGNGYGVIWQDMSELVKAYDENGFVYCFSASVVNRGVGSPEEYSDAVVRKIADRIVQRPTPLPETHTPNFVFVQLESFFDVNYLENVTCSQNPVPNFRKLREQGISGLLTVPVVGAGTVNTEFEVLTGMSLDYFGPGEYPFKTVLQEKTCESVAHDLRRLGYTAQFIHNNDGDFYDRDVVYAQLGFDRYTSLEYMSDVTYNVCGTWPRDEILTSYILGAMTATEQQDLIMAVTVQSHGKYPPNEIPADYEYPIDVAFEDATHEGGVSGIDGLTYYVNEISQVDQFIGDLYDAICAFPEDTVLILYGDHLPSLSITDDDLSVGNTMQTEYVVVSNFGLETQTDSFGELYAYQLYSLVLEQCGIQEGILTKLHQNCRRDPSYQQWLNALEYDMLGTESYNSLKRLFGQEASWPPTEMKFGLEEIKIVSTNYRNGKLYVHGKNFTQASRICVEDKIYKDTVYCGDKLLTLDLSEEEMEEIHTLTVGQVTSAGKLLSSTKAITVS